MKLVTAKPLWQRFEMSFATLPRAWKMSMYRQVFPGMEEAKCQMPFLLLWL